MSLHKIKEVESPAIEVDESVSEVWDLTLQVPADRACDIFAGFTVAEQMNAIQSVLQGRLQAVLAPADSEAA